MRAFIPYTISETDAHLVYAVGDILQREGYTVEYNYDQPMGQTSYDEIDKSTMVVGIITKHEDSQKVTQLWQYAQSQGIPSLLLVEEHAKVPSNIARHKDVHIFKRFAPANPIRFIELYFSHH